MARLGLERMNARFARVQGPAQSRALARIGWRLNTVRLPCRRRREISNPVAVQCLIENVGEDLRAEREGIRQARQSARPTTSRSRTHQTLDESALPMLIQPPTRSGLRASVVCSKGAERVIRAISTSSPGNRFPLRRWREARDYTDRLTDLAQMRSASSRAIQSCRDIDKP